MTWHHVAALLIAALMVVACGLSERCSPQNFGNVVQLATAVVAGAFGHAGASRLTKKSPDDHQRGSDAG